MGFIHEHQRLGEGRVGLHDFDDFFLAVRRHQEQLDPARQHQVKVGGIVALKKQGFALDQVGYVRVAAHALELLVVQFRKQVRCSERLAYSACIQGFIP